MYYRTAIVKQLQIMKFPTGQFILQEFNKEAKRGVRGKLLTSGTVPVVRDTFENTQWRKVENTHCGEKLRGNYYRLVGSGQGDFSSVSAHVPFPHLIPTYHTHV